VFEYALGRFFHVPLELPKLGRLEMASCRLERDRSQVQREHPLGVRPLSEKWTRLRGTARRLP